MSIAALKTWIAEILTPNDLNGEFTNNREYIKENRDMVLGDNAEGTGFSGHNHNATLGVQLAAAGLASNSVITAKILDANVTAAKLAADAVNQQRAVLTQRFKNCELVYEDTDNVTVSFPWTEIGGTAWANVTGIDVSAETGSGGNVKATKGANTASTWYYLYVSNTFTVGQPLVAEFLLTKSAAGETGYTLIGAIYNNASQEIEPFDQFGRYVAWRTPIEDLNGGSETAWTDIPGVDAGGTMTIPAISKVVNVVVYASTGDWGYLRPNGSAWLYTSLYTPLEHIQGLSRIIYTPDQIIEYKTSGDSQEFTVWTLGYYLR